ncbi:MAG: DNA invertase Pin-like site-specific DNA recombinase [Colwellia sp.]|jgi:DNA invertase Pin-like site-specific DNA recombinase
MCKYIAYYRVSTAKQGASGLGLEAQEATVLEHVKATGGYLVDSFTEVESGTKSDREQLQRAMTKAKRTNSRLLIAKLDRLARNTHFITGLMNAGVKFTACDIPDATELTVTIFAAVAQNEAKLVSERTKAAIKAKKEREGSDFKWGSKTLYKLAPKYAHLKATKARVIKANHYKKDMLIHIKEAQENGYKSLRAIAKWLNDNGFETPRGKDFNASSIQRILA